MTEQISKLIAHIVASFEGVGEDNDPTPQKEYQRYEEREPSQRVHSQSANSEYSREEESEYRNEETSELDVTDNSHYSLRNNDREGEDSEEDGDEEEIHVVDIKSNEGEEDNDLFEDYFDNFHINDNQNHLSEIEQEYLNSGNFL